jgi:hypothetical protein
MKHRHIREELFSSLMHWIRERDAVLQKKEAGELRPWTTDSIIANYRFCNVRREDDRVTKWIAVNWRYPHQNNPDIWFWMLIARLLNNPASLAAVGKPAKTWNRDTFEKKLKAYRAGGGQVFNAAYIVSTNGHAMDKVDYIIEHILVPAWDRRAEIRPRKGDTLAQFAERLRSLNGLAGFMTGQVVADVKYTPGLLQASDWMTWAVSGPGSRRGMNRLVGREVTAPWKESEWRALLGELREQVNDQLPKLKELHAQDLQNCLCEFDKYRRALLGEGRPKQTYTPNKGVA